MRSTYRNGLDARLRMYIYRRLCRLASLSAHLNKSAAKVYFQRKRHVASSCTNGYNTYSLGYAIIYLLHAWATSEITNYFSFVYSDIHSQWGKFPKHEQGLVLPRVKWTSMLQCLGQTISENVYWQQVSVVMLFVIQGYPCKCTWQWKCYTV